MCLRLIVKTDVRAVARTVRLVFLWKLQQIRTYNIRKAVPQHTEGMVGSSIWILLENLLLFPAAEKIKDILRNDKDIGMSLDCFVYYFLGDSVFARVIVGPLCWVCNECYFMLFLCMPTCLNCATRMHI